MKKIILILIPIIIIIFPFLVFSHSVSLEEVLSDIMKSQNVSEKSQIECNKVTGEQFEELGEGVMSVMHPDEREHEMMDQMIGGEGSESLKSMHILMGKRYLECVSGIMGTMPMMQMMGGGSNSMMGNMMGWNSLGVGTGWAWLSWIFVILFWILIILAIVALIKWLIDQINGRVKGKSALDTLEERYAKGEISKKEFEEKKKDLTQ